MMGVYLRRRQRLDALQIFEQMQQEGLTTDKVAFINILSACANLAALAEGKRMHARIICGGFESEVVMVTALVNMYGKCGELEHARRIFDGMARRDIVTWNAMIAAYAQHGHGKEALQLFDQMQREGMFPNRATFASILSTCAHLAAPQQGKRMHACVMQAGFESDYVIANALVHMYNKCGSLGDAQNIFDKLSKLNVVPWNAMIATYAQHGHLKDALNLLDRMQQEEVTPDKVNFVNILDACRCQTDLAEGKQIHACIRRHGYETENMIANALVSMYGRCGSLEAARSLFDKMPERNVVSWNAMIAAYAQNGHGKEALELFDKMQQDGVIPDKVTFISALDACATPAAHFGCNRLHSFVLLSGFESDIVVATALVNMYGKNGSLAKARSIFDLIPERNVVSWTAMIAAYSLYGHDMDALQLFQRMLQEGVIPDKVTFLSVICSCGNQALLKKGKIVHIRLRYCTFESELNVANALVNMYGKCGSLDEAWNVFDSMPVRNLATWNVIITAYSQHGLGGEVIFLFYEMQHAGVIPDRVTFVSILSAFSHTGLVDEGIFCLLFMKFNHDVTPGLEHYDCIVDLLARAGQMKEAEIMINKMPFQPTAVSWMTMLGASKNLVDVNHGEHTANFIFELDPEDPVPYVMLSNLYAFVGRVEEAESILNKILKAKQLYSGLSPCQTEGQTEGTYALCLLDVS